MMLSVTEGAAQVPGLPVLQNAFSNPGLAFAANLGGGRGQSFYGAAAAWGLGADGRLSISAAAGAQGTNGATRGAYGARAAVRLWSSSGGGLGAGGFAGFGGAPRTRTGSVVTNPAIATIPAGVTVGYRRALGSRRGLSAYVSPFYRWTRSDSGAVETSGAMRVSAGVDFSLTTSIGITFGGEFGGASGSGSARRSSGAIGGAISFVPGGRR